MSTPLAPPDPLYCRRCKAPIEPSHAHCGRCGWDQSRSYAIAEIEAQEAEAAERRMEYAAQEVTKKEAHRQAVYNTATGHGICPNCKSPNVRPYKYTEGGSSAGRGLACCMGCAFNPLAWALIPFMQGRQKKGWECQYCSNKWRL